jgi:hypothetical protein
MTCEVAVLNRMAVALAADSAVTFTSVANGERKVSYATGANKIFQLSSVAPVGVMLFNNAALQDIPWELIVKSFRSVLAAGTKAALADYATELFSFIQGNQQLFPVEHREKHFRKMAARSFLQMFARAKLESPALQDASQQANHAKELAAFAAKVENHLATLAIPPHFDANDIAQAKALQGPWLANEIARYIAAEYSHLTGAIQVDAFANLAIESLYKAYADHFDAAYTGIVVAGFGEKDYFPGFVELRYYGFLLDKLVMDQTSASAISHQTESLIEAFAKKGMVETFLTGFAPEVWATVRAEYRSHAERLMGDLYPGVQKPANYDALVAQSEAAFSQGWSYRVLDGHYAPLRGVISGLPPDEMAELAETLVMLESFKEKVTQRTQSVGGPIDVAVITRAEGLVWIKRKHYFKPELNHRYFVRQTRTS